MGNCRTHLLCHRTFLSTIYRYAPPSIFSGQFRALATTQKASVSNTTTTLNMTLSRHCSQEPLSASMQDNVNSNDFSDGHLTMPIASCASAINNAAALLLTNDKYDLAITELTKALKLLAKQMRQGNIKSEPSLTGMPEPILAFVPDKAGVFVDLKSTQATSCGDVSLRRQQHRFIFRKPIYLENANVLPPLASTYETLSYAVIYNLALAWQLSGLATVDELSRISMLRKALCLYEKTTNIMANGRVEGDPLLYMSVICNMGALHSCFEDKENEASCQELLLSAIMCCIDSGYRNPQWGVLLEGFLSNVMLRFLSPVAASAA